MVENRPLLNLRLAANVLLIPATGKQASAASLRIGVHLDLVKERYQPMLSQASRHWASWLVASSYLDQTCKGF